jgi:hypothetical protein
MLWWRCYNDHVFAAPPVDAGNEMSCPVLISEGVEEGQVCGTYFIYSAFQSEEAARNGRPMAGPERWAPWARGDENE